MHQGIQQAGFILFLLFICFLAQALKEAGIPTFGLMQGMMMYAGYQISTGAALQASIIICVSMAGSLAGASLVFHLARKKGDRVTNILGRLLPVSPEKTEKACNVLSRSSFITVLAGRMLPGMMLPISFTAGRLHFSCRSFIAGVASQLAIWTGIFVSIGLSTPTILPQFITSTYPVLKPAADAVMITCILAAVIIALKRFSISGIRLPILHG